VSTEFERKALAALSSYGLTLVRPFSSETAASKDFCAESLPTISCTPNRPESEKFELRALAY